MVAASLLPLMWAKAGAERHAEYEERKANVASARADLAGQTLKVADKLKLYAEASVASKLVKTLNGGDTVKATGNIVNTLWVPVEAGTSKGYLYAPRVNVEYDALLESWDIFPYEAKAGKDITIKERGGNKSITLKKGTEVIVKSKHEMAYLNSSDYITTYDDIETFDYVKAISGEIPAEFKKASKKSPIQATVTENIRGQLGKDEGYARVSIPKGTTVEVTGGSKFNNRFDRADVTYDNHKEIGVYWKYLEPKK